MIHPTAQVQSNTQVTDIPLTERQRLKDDYLSTSLRLFSLPLGIGPNDKRTAILSGHLSHYVSHVPRFEPTSFVFLGKCVTH